MNTDMFNEYYNYKIKTVYEYATLLARIIGVDKNKFWHKKKDLEVSLNYIVNDYFKRMISNNLNDVKNINRCFINDKDVFKFGIDREIYSVLNYFIENKRVFEINALQKEIVLSAVILNIANNLDISVSPYKVNKNNYKTILVNYLNKFNKIEYLELIDEKHKNTDILLELIKTNVRKERRIFELLTSINSFNKYVDISKENIYYLTSYNYNVASIKNYDKEAIKKVYSDNHVSNDLCLISYDLVITSLMKFLSLRIFEKIFYLPIKREFIESRLLKNFDNLYKDKFLKYHLRLLVNYDDYNDYRDYLSKYLCTIYLNKNCNSEIENVEGLDIVVSRDYYEDNKEFVDNVLKTSSNVIMEYFEGIKTDKILIEERRG